MNMFCRQCEQTAIGGCDGAKPGRNYYTKFARPVPRNCVILIPASGIFNAGRKEKL